MRADKDECVPFLWFSIRCLFKWYIIIEITPSLVLLPLLLPKFHDIDSRLFLLTFMLTFSKVLVALSTCFLLYYYMIFTWPELNDYSFEIWLWPTQKSRNYSSKRKHETAGLVSISRITSIKIHLYQKYANRKLS